MAIKTYKKGSKTKLSKNFQAYEFDCPCKRCSETPIDEELVKILQAIRDKTGKAVIPNAYRCPVHNAETPNASAVSLHMAGKAADISVRDTSPLKVAQIAEELGVPGIGLYDTFVHVDTGPRKFKWRGHAQEAVQTFFTPTNTADELRNLMSQVEAVLNDAAHECRAVIEAYLKKM